MFSTAPLNLIEADMKVVDQLILDRLSSDVVLINQMGHYIVKNGGKRLRPGIVLLASGACGGIDQDSYLVAAIVEFIHTATLLHDDVVDESKIRRGKETANAVWGNEASVLVGDFLYSRSFELMVEIERMRVMEVFAQTTNLIAAGEVMQLLNIHDAKTSEARYLEVIKRKTAQLFEAAAQLGAILRDSSKENEMALAAYGMHLGVAFQIVDDVLDYVSNEETLGKQLGDDLAEGKPTLPLIYAMQNGSEAQSALIRQAIEKGDREAISDVLEVVNQTGAIEYSIQCAKDHGRKAKQQLQLLDPSEYQSALEYIVDLAVEREF